jgi:site-specific recombinase XerD
MADFGRPGMVSIMQPQSEDISRRLEQPEIEINFRLVPRENEAALSDRELFDYRNRRERFATWLLREGKDPVDKIGYSHSTAKKTFYRVGFFDRYLWDQRGSYVPRPTTDDADDFLEAFSYADYSQSHKHATLHGIKRYFNWRHHEHGEDLWEPERSFNVSNSQTPQDYLTQPERQQIRDAALDYGTIPSYSTVQCKTERRERLKPYIAERCDKPVEDLSIDDWEAYPSWKYTSLVWATLDAGFRPIEIERANLGWVDIENQEFRIPKAESSKSFDNWEVAIRDDTAQALENWIHERSHYPKYDDTDTLWLTRENNPYGDKALGRLLRRLCDKTGIEYENRRMSWYSIRHSVGTYMTREEDLAATQAQLRHKRPETTMKYDAAPPADRRDALNRMG